MSDSSREDLHYDTQQVMGNHINEINVLLTTELIYVFFRKAHAIIH